MVVKKREVIPKKKNVHVGVKIISVLNWISGILMIILGFIALWIGFTKPDFITQNVPLGTPEAVLAELQTTLSYIHRVALIGGFILLPLGIIAIFIAIGLWKGRNWARVTGIVFLLIGAIIALLGITLKPTTNIISLIINGSIACYLLFNKKVKEAFF